MASTTRRCTRHESQRPKWKGKVYDVVYVITYQDGHEMLTTTRYGGSSPGLIMG